MGADSSMRRTTTRTVSLPAGGAAPRTSQTYRVHGTSKGGEYNIGISMQPLDDGSIDDLPPAVYDTISDCAESHVDLDRLGTETTDLDWPSVGMVTLSPVDGRTVNLFFEWLPAYVATPADPSE